MICVGTTPVRVLRYRICVEGRAPLKMAFNIQHRLSEGIVPRATQLSFSIKIQTLIPCVLLNVWRNHAAVLRTIKRRGEGRYKELIIFAAVAAHQE